VLAVAPGSRAWSFFAQGKHPLAKDYLCLGTESRLSFGLSGWLERGFLPLAADAGPRSWRFWARGAGQGALALGLLRGSCDSIGRPYPLLILGQGPLPGWEDNWDLLTLVCDPVWREMERLAETGEGAVPELERRLVALASPRGEWARAAKQCRTAGDDGNYGSSGNYGRSGDSWNSGDSGGELLDSLAHDSFGDPDGGLAFRVTRLFRERGVTLPSLGFLGGAPGAYRYLLFQRALRGSDFGMLWQSSQVEAATP